jgi:uncharacterized iron-regulated protein
MQKILENSAYERQGSAVRILPSVLLLFLASMPSDSTADEKAPSHERCSFWVDVYRGEAEDFDSMMDDVARSRVVYVGEAHTLARHHREQARIIRALIERGKPIVLALEQMESFNQGILDRYNAGVIGFDDLVAQTKWAERWSNYQDYRELVETVRKAGGSVIALNARSELVRETARKGRGGVEGALKHELPEPFKIRVRYEKYIKQLLMQHRFVNDRTLQNVFEAQAVRDDAMARALIGALGGAGADGKIALVIAGSVHVAYGLGIPSRVRSVLPGITERILVLAQGGEVELTDAEKRHTREVDLGHENVRFLTLPIADYLMVAEPHDGMDK